MEKINRTALRGGLAVLGLIAGHGAQAALPADPSSIWTLQLENDALVGTDRYYTSGIRLGWTSPTDAAPGFLSDMGRSLWGDGRQRIAFDLSQSIFTPNNIQLNPPNPQDRPYAGVLLGSFSLLQDTDTSRSLLGLSLGVVGPGSGGEIVQNGWHDVVGNSEAKGWGRQIHNEPLIQVTSERIWRLPLGALDTPVDGLSFDALPELTASVGNWRVYAQTGVQFRMGQGLDADFGAPRIRPGLSGSDAYVATRPFAWYIFGGVSGQLIGYDVTLDGNLFQSSSHVSRQPAVGELQGGVAVLAYGLRLAFTHVVQTQEFHGQHGGLFQFDSVALSAKF